MKKEIVYEVEKFIENFGTEQLYRYKTIMEAQRKFKSEKFVLEHMILECMYTKDEDMLQRLAKRIVQLNEASITYNDDGEVIRYSAVKIMRYGESSDWDKLRAQEGLT